jgi:hypothetical protein
MACFRPWWLGELAAARFKTVAPRALSSLLHIRPGTNARLLRGISGAGIPRGNHVIGKAYFVRQAAILFGLAKATQDPKISAALMDKAADIKLRVNEPAAPRPDDEPPAAI